MSTRAEEARKLHTSAGCNCAQSVAVACHDILNMDEDTAFRMSEGLGAGMAVGSVCGAISACVSVIGAYYSAGLEAHGASKLHTYQKTKEYLEAYENYDGSILCKELKAKRVRHESKSQTCDDVIESAVRIMEGILNEE